MAYHVTLLPFETSRALVHSVASVLRLLVRPPSFGEVVIAFFLVYDAMQY